MVAWRYLDVLTLCRTYRYIEFLEAKQGLLCQKQREWEAAQLPAPERSEGAGLIGGSRESGGQDETQR